MTGLIGWTSPATSRGSSGPCTSSAGVLLAIDVIVPKHGPFPIEHAFGFYGLFGFIACVVLVLVAKQLRRVLMRPEDYYDR